MELTQTGLIDRIITNLGLDGGREGGKFVPAGPKPLPKDEDGPACEEDFNVAAVVGQLLYLSGHSRPEIAYAVNCCARYMFCPRRSHELALKQIGRYLRRTRTRGLFLSSRLRIFWPSMPFQMLILLECMALSVLMILLVLRAGLVL